MHEFFDADGQPCAAAEAFTAVVTREPEWDQESRGRAIRLDEYESSLCPCGCGLPAAKANKPGAGFVVHEVTCRARMALDQHKRGVEADAKKNKLPAGWDDGRFYYATPIDDA